MKTLSVVEKILNEQVDKISLRSKDAKLTLEEIQALQMLAKIQLDINHSHKQLKTQRARLVASPGDRVDDEKLLEYASDKAE